MYVASYVDMEGWVDMLSGWCDTCLPHYTHLPAGHAG